MLRRWSDTDQHSLEAQLDEPQILDVETGTILGDDHGTSQAT